MKPILRLRCRRRGHHRRRCEGLPPEYIPNPSVVRLNRSRQAIGNLATVMDDSDAGRKQPPADPHRHRSKRQPSFGSGNYETVWTQTSHKSPCRIRSNSAADINLSRTVGKLDVPSWFFSGHDIRAEGSWAPSRRICRQRQGVPAMHPAHRRPVCYRAGRLRPPDGN